MSTSQETWDKRFQLIARNVAGWSKDPDEGVGALVVSADRRQVSWGYNGFPRGHSDHPSVLGNKDLKNRLTIHAERNALDNAPFDLRGATLYVTKPPCTECMKGLIQKGVARVVFENLREGSRWFADQQFALELGSLHGVKLVHLQDCVDFSRVLGSIDDGF